MPCRASQCPYSHTSGRHETLLVPVFLLPFEGMPDTVPGGTTAYAIPPVLDRVCGIVGLFTDTVPGCMVAYAIHPEQVGLWLFMGSEIQATFSLRTFHDAHTAGVGQQVADYVAGCCIHARVGCQQNPLFVNLCRCRCCSAAWFVTRPKLSMGL